MRLFIAIDLDTCLKATIADFVRKLKKHGSANVGWIKDAGMHITLKFLGEVDDATAASVRGLMMSTAASVAAFSLKIRGTGCFPPNARIPRILWIGTAAEPVLGEVQARLEAGLERLGFPRDERPFHPHLTLGRVKSPSGLDDILAELGHSRTADFGEMDVRRLTLFQSVLKPSGAEYTILAEAPLK